MSNIEEGGGAFKKAMHDARWDLALLEDGKPYNNGWMSVNPIQLTKLKKKIQNQIPGVDFGKSTALSNFMNGKGKSSACVQFYTNKEWPFTPVINWFEGDCINRNGAQHLDYPETVNINGTVKNFPKELIDAWQNSNQWTPGTYTEAYTIAPAALYQEGITNTSPSSCFTGADTAPPYTQDPNGSCQKNTAGSYGNSFGYDIYQNTVTYDPNSNLNYGYTDGAVESYAMVQHPMSGYLNQTQQNNHRGHQTAAFEQWKHKNTYMIEF
jgi:hypothetical protein